MKLHLALLFVLVLLPAALRPWSTGEEESGRTPHGTCAERE